jgi:DNA-binding CsgD family transcriptional regulator
MPLPLPMPRTADPGEVPWDAIARFARDHALSEREYEVLRSACQGRASKETAYLMKCSRHTVDEYWSRIFRKTGCRSQIAVLATILRQQMSGGCANACGDHRDATEKVRSR